MIAASVLVVLFLIVFLRGGRLHNYLVYECERISKLSGFKTKVESPVQLPDGQLNFIDLVVQRKDVLICIEVETSARNILSNAKKADQLGLPLIVVVPNRKVLKAVQRIIAKSILCPGGSPISILLTKQLEKQLSVQQRNK